MTSPLIAVTCRGSWAVRGLPPRMLVTDPARVILPLLQTEPFPVEHCEACFGSGNGFCTLHAHTPWRGPVQYLSGPGVDVEGLPAGRQSQAVVRVSGSLEGSRRCAAHDT